MRPQHHGYALLLFSLYVFHILFSGCALQRSSLKTKASKQQDWSATESFDSVPWDLGPQEQLGNSLPGIWSSLTEAEIKALSQLDKAKAGDPEALLRLFILASGTKRDAADLARYQAKIKTFCDSIAPKMSAVSTKKTKARILFKAMYPYFIKTKGSNPIYGYDFDYSDLARLLDEKIYNCVSITMLYVLLGAHFQLDIEPVKMPGHAFAQLRLDSGKVLEIETVTREGFGVTHDKAFFREQARLMAAVYGRNLTYADYQQRRIVRPWELALENMRNQHTMPSVIGVQGHFRLRELQSVMQPTDSAFRKERLGLYFEVVRRAKVDSNFNQTLRFGQVVKGFLDTVHTAAESDTSLRILYAHLRWHQAEAYMRRKERPKDDKDTSWFAFIDAATYVMRYDSSDWNHVYANSRALLEMRWVKQVDMRRFAAVEKEMHRFAKLCRTPGQSNSKSKTQGQDPCKATREWLYQNWAAWHWDSQAWNLAIQKLELANQQAGANQKTIQENIGYAYVNWSNDFVEKKDYQGSLRILKTCIEKSPYPKPCRERIAELKKYGVI